MDNTLLIRPGAYLRITAVERNILIGITVTINSEIIYYNILYN